MRTKDFYFDLPEELIAQDPLEDRSGSRLMVLDKKTGEVEHRIFKDILEYLKQFEDINIDAMPQITQFMKCELKM